VANSYVSQYLKIRLFWIKKSSFDFIYTLKYFYQKSVKSDGRGCKIFSNGYVTEDALLLDH
jgi:hypothetical protein